MNLPHEHHHKRNTEKIFNNMPSCENFLSVAEPFKLLGDPTRLQLFWILCHTEECVINLAAILDVSSPAISHHIRFLKENKLIVSRKDGKEVYYKSADNEIVKILHNTIEKLMKSTCPMTADGKCENCSFSHKENIISQIHDYMIDNLDKRITIEELSKQFHINPTTIKLKFKDVYGHSVAAHIKEHRMEKAAKLLLESDFAIAEISTLVGYTSSSKFSTSFSETYGMLPTEYRKKYSQ